MSQRVIAKTTAPFESYSFIRGGHTRGYRNSLPALGENAKITPKIKVSKIY
jgi:hypothetical protein